MEFLISDVWRELKETPHWSTSWRLSSLRRPRKAGRWSWCVSLEKNRTVSYVLHQLDAEQKLEQARIFKEKGTKHFKVYLIFPSFPLCNRCANVSGDSEHILLSLQDQKYEIASSRYQKVIFQEPAGSLIIWGVEEKMKVWLDDCLRWLISLSTRSPWKGRQKTSARLCCRWAARITLAHQIYMLIYDTNVSTRCGGRPH